MYESNAILALEHDDIAEFVVCAATLIDRLPSPLATHPALVSLHALVQLGDGGVSELAILSARVRIDRQSDEKRSLRVFMCAIGVVHHTFRSPTTLLLLGMRNAGENGCEVSASAAALATASIDHNYHQVCLNVLA